MTPLSGAGLWLAVIIAPIVTPPLLRLRRTARRPILTRVATDFLLSSMCLFVTCAPVQDMIEQLCFGSEPGCAIFNELFMAPSGRNRFLQLQFPQVEATLGEKRWPPSKLPPRLLTSEKIFKINFSSVSSDFLNFSTCCHLICSILLACLSKSAPLPVFLPPSS